MVTIMTGIINLGLLVIIFTNRIGVHSSPIDRIAVGEPNKNNCALKGLAKYNITFEGLWSKDVFFKQYPLYRPNAQWSKVLGRIHSSKYSLWKMGSQASHSLRKFVEKGKSDDFDKRDTQGTGGVFDSFRVKQITTGVGKTWAVVFADEDHHLVSTAAKIVPSPDWFAGVDSLDLCNNNRWLESKTIDLHPLDAGTDKGFTFTSPNWMENPFRPIYQITSQFPSHPANSFYYAEKNELPPIAKLYIERLSNYGQVDKINVDNFNTRDEYPHSFQSHSEDGKTSVITNKKGEGTLEDQVTPDKQIYNPLTTDKGKGSSTKFGITDTEERETHIDQVTPKKHISYPVYSTEKEEEHPIGMDIPQNAITETDGQSEISDDTLTEGYIEGYGSKFKKTDDDDYENNRASSSDYIDKNLVSTESFKDGLKSPIEHESSRKYDVVSDINSIYSVSNFGAGGGGHHDIERTEHPSEHDAIALTIENSQNSASKALISSHRPIVKISVINSKMSSFTTDGMTMHHDVEPVDLSDGSKATKRSNIVIQNVQLASKLKPTIINYTETSQTTDQSKNATALSSKPTEIKNTATLNRISALNTKLSDSLEGHRYRIPTFFSTTQTILNDFVHKDLVKEHSKKQSENVNQSEEEPEIIASDEENKWKPVNCVLSEEWGEWTPCSKTCGYGTRTRVKLIELQSENGGAMCKQSPEVELCGSMRTCTKWKHFSFRNWGMGSHKDDHLKVKDN